MTGTKSVSWLVVAVSPLLLWVGEASAQGAEFTLNCRADEVLVGVSGRQGWWMDAIAARCRSVNANGSLGTSVRTTAFRGGSGGTQRTVQCGREEVVAGFSGSLGSNGYVLYVHELICAPWAAGTRTAGTPWRTVNAFERKSGSGTWISDTCTQGRVGTRLRGRAGNYLDRLFDVGCNYAAGATPPSRPVVQRSPPPQITAAPAPVGPAGSYNVTLCPQPENPLFSWQAAPSATAYIVEYHNVSRRRTQSQRVATTSTRPPAMFLSGEQYRWRVRGTNATGDGPWSEFLNFTGQQGDSASPCVSSGRQPYF
jgi:hypothetical protein